MKNLCGDFGGNYNIFAPTDGEKNNKTQKTGIKEQKDTFKCSYYDDKIHNVKAFSRYRNGGGTVNGQS